MYGVLAAPAKYIVRAGFVCEGREDEPEGRNEISSSPLFCFQLRNSRHSQEGYFSRELYLHLAVADKHRCAAAMALEAPLIPIAQERGRGAERKGREREREEMGISLI